jgi:hypothetical protein
VEVALDTWQICIVEKKLEGLLIYALEKGVLFPYCAVHIFLRNHNIWHALRLLNRNQGF